MIGKLSTNSSSLEINAMALRDRWHDTISVDHSETSMSLIRCTNRISVLVSEFNELKSSNRLSDRFVSHEVVNAFIRLINFWDKIKIVEHLFQ